MVTLKGQEHMKHTVLFICGIALLTAGCTKVETVDTDPVNINPLAGETVPRHLSIDISVNQDGPDARAVKTGWEEGDIVHIYFGVNDVGVGGNAMDHLTMTYSGGEWSYSDLSTKLENALLNQRTGYIYGLYLPVGEPANEYHTFDADQQLWLKLSNGSDTVVGISYAGSSGTDEYSIDANDKLTATMTLSVPDDFVQFFIPGIEDATNYEFTCNQLKSFVPNSITWGTSGFSMSVWDRNYGLPLKGYIYEKDNQKGLVVCGKISKPGQSADYTFTVRNTNGTSGTGDDYVFTKSYTGKTLNAKDAVKLPVLGSWARNFTDINGHDFVDMGNGLLWATCNLGATNPEDYGNYYAWGETQTKTYYSLTNYKHLAPEPHTLPYLEGYINKYQFDDATYSVVLRYNTIWYDENKNFIGDNKLVLDPEDDAAIANWGGPWRIPRKEEFDWLQNNSSCTLTDDYQGTGVKGMIVTSIVPGFESSTLFFPFAGHMGDTQETVGKYGYYWSADIGGYTHHAMYLSTYEYLGNPSGSPAVFKTSSIYRPYGQSVRAVASF